MNTKIKVLIVTVLVASFMFALVVAGLSEPDVVNNEERLYSSSEKLTDVEEEGVVKTTLLMYGYDVVNVEADYDVVLGNYVVVGMISEGKTNKDINEQVGAGLGALYGVYDNKDYYIVALKYDFNNENDIICSYGIDGNVLTDYFNEEISTVEMVEYLKREYTLVYVGKNP